MLPVLHLSFVLLSSIAIALSLGCVKLCEIALEVVETGRMLVHDVSSDGIEEGTIVGDNEEGRRPGLKIIFEPCECVQINVIGRLVYNREKDEKT